MFVRNVKPWVLPGAIAASLGIVVLWPTVHRSLVNSDDLILLSTVNHGFPSRSLWRDWGIGNGLFRPAHPVVLWVLYQLFGADPQPQQLLNLALHATCAALIVRTVMAFGGRRATAGAVACLFAVSPLVFPSASWVSDRTSLVVAALLLLWLSADRSSPRWLPLGVGAAGVALLWKESGIVLLVAVVFFAWQRRARRTLWAGGAVVVLYLAIRTAALGGLGSYRAPGVVLGRSYDSVDALPLPWQAAAAAQHAIETLVGPFLPTVVVDGGGLRTGSEILRAAKVWLPALVLAAVACRRPLTELQRVGLLVIVANAAVHFSVYRTRNLYLAEIGFVLVVAGAKLSTRLVRSVFATASVVLVVFSARAVHHSSTTLPHDLSSSEIESRAREHQRVHPGINDRAVEEAASTG